jgi:hypothetical protein
MTADRTTAVPPEPASTVSEMPEQFVGIEIYGGCESCDAHQTVAPLGGQGVFRLTVHHDDSCPEQSAREDPL